MLEKCVLSLIEVEVRGPLTDETECPKNNLIF